MEADLAQAAAETLERRPFARATSQPRLTGELLAEGHADVSEPGRSATRGQHVREERNERLVSASRELERARLRGRGVGLRGTPCPRAAAAAAPLVARHE